MKGPAQEQLIVDATVADIPQILEIVNDIIINTTTNYLYEPMSLDEMLQWFTEMLEKNYPVIVFKKGHEVLGYSCYSQFRKKIGYQFCMEHSVYVRKDQHGKGIGKRLMEHLIDLAKKNRVHTLVAGIDTGNPASIDFHKKMGFKEVGHIKEAGFKFNRWLDLVFMQKMI